MFSETPSNIVFAGYADYNTSCTDSSNMQTVLNNLQEAIEKLFQRLSANYLEVNFGNCHLLASSKTAMDIHISDATVSKKNKSKY